jgi:uncharacterized OB-fold protein
MAEFGPEASDPLARPFWEGARAQRLLLPFARASGAPCWYPRAGTEIEWREVGGGATLFAFTVVRGPLNPDFEPPYAPALVELAEAPGMRLVTQLVDCDFDTLECGMPLELCFRELRPRERAAFVAPVFRPVR